MTKIGIQLQRRGSLQKPRKAKEKWVREKRCPDCGRRFATRTALKEHLMAATEG